MNETIKMWKLVRFIQENYVTTAVLDYTGVESLRGTVDESFLKQIAISRLTDSPRVYRTAILQMFSDKRHSKKIDFRKDLIPKEKINTTRNKINKDILVTNRIIERCLAEKLICPDDHNNLLIYVSVTGGKFATCGGLVKAVGENILEITRPWILILGSLGIGFLVRYGISYIMKLID